MDLAYIWFWVVGVLFVGYFVLDGFDFGVGMALPFIGKDDISRRQMINTIGPVWDFNETWLVAAGACLFAGFPEWYATLFSGFYLALFLIIVAIIIRGVSFEYRHQRESLRWKKTFDWMIIIGSTMIPLLWGVAVANLLQGTPIDSTFEFTGSLLTLLNPYALLGGVTMVFLSFTHGLSFLTLKTDGQVREDSRRLARTAGAITIVLAASFLIWTIAIAASHGAPALILALVTAALAAVCLIGSLAANFIKKEGLSFTLGAVTIGLAVVTVWLSLFPNVMISSTSSANNLTIENSSSSPYALTIMTWGGIIIIPLVILYQAWTYWVFRKRVTRDRISRASASESATAH